MRDINITETDIERLASEALAVPREMDLGESCQGGHYYLALAEGLGTVVSSEELREVAEMAIAGYFSERQGELKESLAGWMEGQRLATAEAQAEGDSL